MSMTEYIYDSAHDNHMHQENIIGLENGLEIA